LAEAVLVAVQGEAAEALEVTDAQSLVNLLAAAVQRKPSKYLRMEAIPLLLAMAGKVHQIVDKTRRLMT
jgi:hypothetical protein